MTEAMDHSSKFSSLLVWSQVYSFRNWLDAQAKFTQEEGDTPIYYTMQDDFMQEGDETLTTCLTTSRRKRVLSIGWRKMKHLLCV